MGQSDIDYMQQAIAEGKQNPAAPFGAVLVASSTGAVVARGVNASSQNPVLHGEIVAIQHYAEQQMNRWRDLTLYTTAEPCCMCQAAILWAGIGRVVFGTSIRRLSELGWRQFDLTAAEVIARSWTPRLPIIGGICQSECDALFESAAEIGNS